MVSRHGIGLLRDLLQLIVCSHPQWPPCVSPRALGAMKEGATNLLGMSATYLLLFHSVFSSESSYSVLSRRTRLAARSVIVPENEMSMSNKWTRKRIK